MGLSGFRYQYRDVGMSLFTIANLEVDSRIQIELLMPQSRSRVRVDGIIRHRALYLYGVEFIIDSGRVSKPILDDTITSTTRS